MISTDPITTGMSSVFNAVTISFPIPRHPKIYSTNTAPASIDANHPETAVITGFNEFFNACRYTIDKGDKPLALAVRI